MTAAPQNDPELIAKLAAMTSDEFAAVVSKARGDTAARRRRITDDITTKTAQLFAPATEEHP